MQRRDNKQQRSTITGNTAGNAVGGIYNVGWVTLTNSTVSGNAADEEGTADIYDP